MKIKSHNQSLAIALCAAGTVPIALCSLIVWLKLRDGSATFLLFAVTGVLIAAGAGLIAWGVRYIIRSVRFGEATLDIPGGPVKVGGILEGTLRIARRFAPDGPMKLTMRCLDHEVRYVRHNGSSTRTRETSIKVLWEHNEERDLTQGSVVAGIPIRLEIPAAQPPSSGDASTGGIRWQLEVTIPAPGVDFHATFDFPTV